jgi:hypothetical protein
MPFGLCHVMVVVRGRDWQEVVEGCHGESVEFGGLFVVFVGGG